MKRQVLHRARAQLKDPEKKQPSLHFLQFLRLGHLWSDESDFSVESNAVSTTNDTKGKYRPHTIFTLTFHPHKHTVKIYHSLKLQTTSKRVKDQYYIFAIPSDFIQTRKKTQATFWSEVQYKLMTNLELLLLKIPNCLVILSYRRSTPFIQITQQVDVQKGKGKEKDQGTSMHKKEKEIRNTNSVFQLLSLRSFFFIHRHISSEVFPVERNISKSFGRKQVMYLGVLK